ncbi:pD129L [African swine fever virus]|uniref:PD129L n=1 Tax=African swine fever virus TaxID=10497 RepID=A0A8A1UJ80_ASF|nr:pD129L [African swine fever virus]
MIFILCFYKLSIIKSTLWGFRGFTLVILRADIMFFGFVITGEPIVYFLLIQHLYKIFQAFAIVTILIIHTNIGAFLIVSSLFRVYIRLHGICKSIKIRCVRLLFQNMALRIICGCIVVICLQIYYGIYI